MFDSKKFLLLALSFTLIFCCFNVIQFTMAEAVHRSPSSSPYEIILQNNLETIKVGYLKETSFIYEDIPGHMTGYGHEYMEFLSNYAHCNFEYIEFEDWDVMVSKLQSGEIDVMPDMPGDYKKLSNVTRTDHVVGRFPMEIITHGVKPTMRLGRLTFSHDTPTLSQIAADEGFSYEIVPYKSFWAMMSDFHDKKIDGYVNAMLDPHKSKDVLAVFDRQSYRLLVRSDRKDLLNRLNLAMDQMLMYQPNIRDRLNATYLNSNGFPLTLSNMERNYLEDKGKLKTAIFLAHQPYAYRDENNQLVGFVPELIKKISQDLNIEIEIIERKTVPEIQEMLKRGELDFVADAVCDYSWAESFNAKPTNPYLELEYIPVTRRDYPLNFEDRNTKIACVKDAYHTAHFIELNFAETQRVYVASYEDALKAVNEGLADVTFVQRNTAQTLFEDTETYLLEMRTSSLYSEPRSLGVYSNADPHLWQILNKEIGSIDPDWIREVLNKNQHIPTHFSLKWVIYHHPFRTSLVVILLAFAIGGFIIYRNRTRQRHFELVEHMAYTDLRYDLPNVPWLEKTVPNVMDDLKDTEPNMQTFFVVFSIASSAAATKIQGHRLIDKQFKKMAKNLAEEKTVLLTAAGIDVDHIICFCKAENVDYIVEWVKGVIESNSYMETAAESAKIVLHTRAGITPYHHEVYVEQAVDRALIACHQSISGSFQIFDEDLQETLTMEHSIEGRMEQALIDGEFKAWYQPKYDIKTREIVGAEALVRWISPEMGFMPPGKFIPLFERNGFVIQVDYYLLEQTCKLQRARLDAGLEVVPISVNQSRLHMTEEGYLDKIKMIRDTFELPDGLIELEVTETIFGDFDAKAGQQNAEYIIDELHKMGFSISVDDFGSGYSSFMMLGSLPMDVMKIDRSLLTGADKSPRLREILRNVINLGNSLQMRVLCEGIETKEQEELLLELGCHYGQGFLNAKPMPADDFVEFLEKRNAEVRGANN